MLGLAFAMSGAPGGGAAGATGGMAMVNQILPLVLMFAIFYFLLIRPQQKKAKEHKALLEAIKKGDNVVTASGIYGKIMAVEDGVVSLEVSTGVVIKIGKEHIAGLVNK
jgi:preprotein translocase subunit YajC